MGTRRDSTRDAAPWPGCMAPDGGECCPQYTALLAERDRLRRELTARAIRTMGPRSPYWNCTMCGASQQTPIFFKHKPECILADEPNPSALVPEDQHKHFYSIEVQHAELLAALQAMLDTHGKPMREEWMNDAGFEHARKVDAQARAAITKATGSEYVPGPATALTD